MADDLAIKVDGLYKTFKLPHEKHNSIKSALINIGKSKRGFESQAVLKDISFEIKKGEFFGVVGRNGSGKSTLLKLLAGIYTADKGNIDINGTLTPFIELGVGFNPELTGRENVFLNGALLGFGRTEMEKMYKDIVRFAELERFMDQKLKNYSSGMQVRLAFSIAIRARSDVLLIDEVLAVGDLSFQEKCYKVFEDIKASGRTVVFISHDSGAIERFCDRVAIVDQGKLVNIGDPTEMVLEYGAIVAEEQLKEKVYIDKDSTKHTGTGALTLQKVEIANSKGKIQSSVKFNEPFTMHIHYKLNKRIKDTPIIGIDIIDDQGVSVLGPNTKEAKEAFAITKSGTVNAEFSLNPLSPGTYSVTVGVYNENASMAYDLVEDIAKFKIIGEPRHGKIYIEPRWSITANSK